MTVLFRKTVKIAPSHARTLGCWLVLASATACGGDGGPSGSTNTGGESGSTTGSTSSAGSTGVTATSATGGSTTTGSDTPAGGENGPGCPPGEVTPDTLPMGTVGEPYTVTITHNVPASTGEVTLLGMLPPGLAETPGNGEIVVAGTPTATGEFPLSVISSTNDGGTCLPEKEYMLVITDGAVTTGDAMTGGTDTSGG